MTPNQIRLIQDSWRMIEPLIDTTAVLFYNRLFEIDPTTKRLFANTDMTRQRDKLLDTLSLTVEHVEQIEKISDVLEDLGKRHADYGVEDRHYDSVRNALLWALEQGLGSMFSDEASAAWAATYELMAVPMRKGAQGNLP